MKKTGCTCTGTDKQVPAEAWLCTGEKQMAYAKRLNTELGRKIAGAVNGKVFAGGKVPSVKRRISCVYADLRELFSEMELLKTA